MTNVMEFPGDGSLLALAHSLGVKMGAATWSCDRMDDERGSSDAARSCGCSRRDRLQPRGACRLGDLLPSDRERAMSCTGSYRRGCRCEKCRASHNQANKDYWARNRERERAKQRARRAVLAQDPQWVEENNELKRKWAVTTDYDRNRDPEKIRARRLLQSAVRRGTITRQACACGNPDTQGHHEDYSKPLDVLWLCARCHADLHREARCA